MIDTVAAAGYISMQDQHPNALRQDMCSLLLFVMLESRINSGNFDEGVRTGGEGGTSNGRRNRPSPDLVLFPQAGTSVSQPLPILSFSFSLSLFLAFPLSRSSWVPGCQPATAHGCVKSESKPEPEDDRESAIILPVYSGKATGI